jgi:hypothetical protein
MKFNSPKIIHNAYIKCYRVKVLMNKNLKIATLGVILGAVLAFGIVATVGIVTTGNLVTPVHAQGNMSAGGNETGGNMTGGNMTGGNMTK